MKLDNKKLSSRSLGRLVAKELTGDALKRASGASKNELMASKSYTDSSFNGPWGDCDPIP
ncbi:hypothetical protein [Pseudoalteromonas luteoviolacea]|uniref:Uncharacterized protein n=1 Tax=Pseudoalteromonas luteoviolacea S4054 TaxID=1129367 RepID=A0A0F6A8R0_9GAMM|nr:hypothetical protein [Pseudoalteromonas luteoviolacea]AOT08659.1 hypothetical protein S4054249_12695 [Pseudoalteromonas luteoviolacea]AOT13574.1 hypothetical protein S40542_12670 [Pseudoalteromonas luteoviolacea]AOT18487.1 hypothetical protein S4054_12670 [Pseudoalteromonas luteoviolacea]KKE82513.1 hypothetical protein N479_18065 [Pseudoalteromonas luteoviolacea S4054]KZN72050.1 hypothetical protein N481_16700 [Pseudoalteromonas luteoviolacea S4047-1]